MKLAERVKDESLQRGVNLILAGTDKHMRPLPLSKAPGRVPHSVRREFANVTDHQRRAKRLRGAVAEKRRTQRVRP